MMKNGASLFVVVFTLVNILAYVWLMWWTAHTRPATHTHDDAGATNDKTGHVWDGDLEEYNNPLPRWWLGLFILTILFGIAYLIYFPGLGNFTGQGGWSQVGAYEIAMQQQQAKLEQRFAAVKDKDLRELAQDESAMATAKNLFGANCSTCHGSDARGAKGFPNLTDADWQWGGGEANVLEAIRNGRHGVMPALGSALGETGVNEAASYVATLSGRKAPADWVAAGAKHFTTLCAACHGADAKGNPLLGAPNLTDTIWLYGGDFESIRASITSGRSGEMPAHAQLLGETKIRLLAAYVLSLNSKSWTPGAGENAAAISSTAPSSGRATSAPETRPGTIEGESHPLEQPTSDIAG